MKLTNNFYKNGYKKHDANIVKAKAFTSLSKMDHFNEWTIHSGAFIDFSFFPTPRIREYSKITNLKGYFLGSVGVATINGEPKACWGGTVEKYDSSLREMFSPDVTVSDFAKFDIDIFREKGGEVVLSFGGPTVPIEVQIADKDKLVNIYNKTIKNYSLQAIDFNFDKQFLANTEAVNRHIEAVKELSQNSKIKVSYTFSVGGKDGLLGGFDLLEKSFLQKLYDNQIKPSLINGLVITTNALAAENLFEATKSAAIQVHNDILKIWKGAKSEDIWSHMGICPMFGKHPNGEIFTLEDQKKLNEWAKYLGVGCLNGWDATRDHNPNIMELSDYKAGEFCKILSQYKPFDEPTQLTGQAEINND